MTEIKGISEIPQPDNQPGKDQKTERDRKKAVEKKPESKDDLVEVGHEDPASELSQLRTILTELEKQAANPNFKDEDRKRAEYDMQRAAQRIQELEKEINEK